MATLPAGAALLIVDLQKAIDDPVWAALGPRNNPGAEVAAERLLAAWRAAEWPIIHVRHDSTEPQSTYRPGQPGHSFKLIPRSGEMVVAKHAHSAFVDTGLAERLREAGSGHLVICGVITNNSVEATVRHAADLGFRVTLAEDACFTFARRDYAGRLHSAQEVHAMSLANLVGEYAEIGVVSDILVRVGGN